MSALLESTRQSVIGQTGNWYSHGLRIQVKVCDARKVWDRVDLLIEPVAGSGREWVSASSVSDIK